MKYVCEFGEFDVRPVICEYVMGGTAVQLVEEDGCPFATLTVNLGFHLPEELAFIDTNNLPDAEKFIAENDLGTATGVVVESGFCSYPQYHLDLDRIKALADEPFVA